MGCWMYAILAVWFVWLLAPWASRQMRAAFPIIDPRLFDEKPEDTAHEDLQGQRG